MRDRVINRTKQSTTLVSVFTLVLCLLGSLTPLLPSDETVLAVATWSEHTVAENFDCAYQDYPVDIDTDSDADILGASQYNDTIAGWENLMVASLSTQMNEIQTQVNQLRELGTLGEVYRQFISRDELRQKLVEDFEEDRGDVNISQEILVLLDMMEEEQDLYTILLDLNTEEILGFYDYEENEIYVISNVVQLGPVDKITYAHEFTHALQDQHFDLSSLGLDNEDNSDLAMAVSSLVEGDASLLEGLYYWYYLNDAEREQYDQEAAEYDMGTFEGAPVVVQESLLFPYVVGLDFVYYIYEQGGWDAVNNVHSNLPQSTEQIIHPQKYLSHDNPQSVILPDLEDTLGGTWSQLDNDVLGELYMRLYLESFIDTTEATTAAEGWDGDSYVYLKDASDNKLLVLSSIWDSEGDANEFFDAYVDFMEAKSGGTWYWSSNEAGGNRKLWDSDGMSFYLGQQGTEVLIVIAPDETTTVQVLTEFPQFYSAPHADFSVDRAEVTKGKNIQFTNLSFGGTPLTYEWDFDGDGIADSTAESPKYTYSTLGSYTVVLKVTDLAGNIAMETKVDYITVSLKKGLDLWIWIVIGIGASLVAVVLGGVAYLLSRRLLAG